MTTRSLPLAVCCLNVSEGRAFHVVEAIAEAAVSNQSRWQNDSDLSSNCCDLQCKTTVLSVYTDRTFNRGNVTIAAPVDWLSTSVVQACRTAFHEINLECHTTAGHPRLGAVDLIPIHPIANTLSLNACGVIAKDISKGLLSAVDGFSAFYFGHADTLRRGLIERRKEMRWFENENKCKPDEGVFRGNRGITAIGAIPYMSVMNVLLDTVDLEVGRDIAASIRASNTKTGLIGIQAMAFLKDNGVEIACNIDTNDLQGDQPTFSTSFYELKNTIEMLAKQRNIKVIGQSLQGFSPQEAYEIAYKALCDGDHAVWRNIDVLVM